MPSAPLATTVFISRDSALIDTVHECTASIAGCRLRAFPSLAMATTELARPDAIVAIVHIEHADDTVIVDELIGEAASTGAARAVLAICDEHCPRTMIALFRKGVVDCLCRPLDLRRMEFLLDSLTLRARYENRTAVTGEAGSEGLIPRAVGDAFLCESPEMQSRVSRVLKVAQHDTCLLITGETGSGKTQLARIVHEASPRREDPFLVVNCGALSENLIESELFGHRKGAFTGADADRIGKFAATREGTLFLDEIDSLPLSCQQKLLRAVEDHEFEQIGSNRTDKFRGRLVVASNRNLETEVADGRFRADLYYRLNVIEIQLPALRERRSEILDLAEHFAREFADELGANVPRITAAATQILENYSWPGNVRELRNAIRHAATFCSGNVIRPPDFPERLLDSLEPSTDQNLLADSQISEAGASDSLSSQPSPLAGARMRGEIQQIMHALTEAGNNRSQAARLLGISRVALYKKLHKYDLMDALQ